MKRLSALMQQRPLFSDLLRIRTCYSYCNLLFHFFIVDVIVRPLSAVGYTSVVASVIQSRQWSN